MRLKITADIDVEESGLDPEEIKEDIMQFAKDLLIIGAAELDIGLALREAECGDL